MQARANPASSPPDPKRLLLEEDYSASFSSACSIPSSTACAGFAPPAGSPTFSKIYRCRWQVELFFKWLKCILGCRHLLAESPAGVAIQIYTALIAALMLQVLTGRKPGKRQMEMIRFCLMGYVGIGEMTALLGLGKAEG